MHSQLFGAHRPKNGPSSIYCMRWRLRGISMGYDQKNDELDPSAQAQANKGEPDEGVLQLSLSTQQPFWGCWVDPSPLSGGCSATMINGCDLDEVTPMVAQGKRGRVLGATGVRYGRPCLGPTGGWRRFVPPLCRPHRCFSATSHQWSACPTLSCVLCQKVLTFVPLNLGLV